MENKKRLIIFLAIAVATIIAAVVLTVWQINRERTGGAERRDTVSPSPGTSSAPAATSSASEAPGLEGEWQKIYDADKDFDGLSDEEENKLGTSQTSADTDKDGLLDRDEIQVYNTDPRNPDTDGDSYRDGYEVRRGYNPRGKGRL